jgi:transposase
VRFVLLPGQRHDTIGVPPLIDGVAVIPPRTTRKARFPFDRDMYRWRHLIENTFAKLKEFRAVATRYDKTDGSYQAGISLAAAVIASR